MIVNPARWIFCAFFLAAFTVSANAQVRTPSTTQSTTTSRSTSTTSGGATGQSISSAAQSFAEGVPELQQSQAIRDTQTRGAFVGADTGDLPEVFGGSQATGGRSQNIRGSSTIPRGGQQSPTTQRSSGPTIRPTLALGFGYTPKVSPKLGENLTSRLHRIPSFEGNSSVQVRLENGIVILEGTVARPNDRALAMQLVSLEPGVVKIDNRLQIAE